jgi:Dam-replacing HTH domain
VRRIRPGKATAISRSHWRSEILLVVNLYEGEFTNQNIYEHVRHFKAIFPKNHTIRDKIRQQLQYLRDAGVLKHIKRGHWRRIATQRARQKLISIIEEEKVTYTRRRISAAA